VAQVVRRVLGGTPGREGESLESLQVARVADREQRAGTVLADVLADFKGQARGQRDLSGLPGHAVLERYHPPGLNLP
jgi:hypothetical protein